MSGDNECLRYSIKVYKSTIFVTKLMHEHILRDT